MDDALLKAIKKFAPSGSKAAIAPPPSLAAVANAEASLGFPIPPLLKSVYLEIGDGGFGPEYGIIGIETAPASDHGTLVEALDGIKEGAAFSGTSWPEGLLPFCEWGCNIASCVDCTKAPFQMFVAEECVPYPQDYDLEEFFRMWIAGTKILDRGKTEEYSVEFVNPFTRKKETVVRRRRIKE